MLGLYYRIWVDGIKRSSAQPGNKHNWPAKMMIFMSMAMALNLGLIMIVLQKYLIGTYFYQIGFTVPGPLGKVLNFFILFLLPCLLINYLLIFRKQRYKKLLKKYPSYNGKLSITYLLISILLPVILLWVGMIFFRN